MFRHGKLQDQWFTKFNRKNLWRIHSFMRDNVIPEILDVKDKLFQQIDKFLRLRTAHSSQRHNKNSLVLNILWSSKSLRAIPLRKIISSSVNWNLLPPTTSEMVSGVKLRHSLTPSIGKVVFNYAKVSRELKVPAPDAKCPCRRYPVKFRPDNGCVLSGDLTLLSP